MAALEAGKLRHRLVLQQPVETQDSTSGATVVTWQDVATIWGSIEPSSAREFVAAQAEANKITAKIIIRYRADITARMRLLHVATGLYYNVEGILSDKDSGRDYLTLPVSQGLKYEGDTDES